MNRQTRGLLMLGAIGAIGFWLYKQLSTPTAQNLVYRLKRAKVPATPVEAAATAAATPAETAQAASVNNMTTDPDALFSYAKAHGWNSLTLAQKNILTSSGKI